MRSIPPPTGLNRHSFNNPTSSDSPDYEYFDEVFVLPFETSIDMNYVLSLMIRILPKDISRIIIFAIIVSLSFLVLAFSVWKPSIRPDDGPYFSGQESDHLSFSGIALIGRKRSYHF